MPGEIILLKKFSIRSLKNVPTDPKVSINITSIIRANTGNARNLLVTTASILSETVGLSDDLGLITVFLTSSSM